MNKFHVIVIGAGSTGSALAHDLALRGLQVTVIERGGIAGGTTGHNHGQLHSGGRYVVNDPEAARECILENEILRKIAPSILELNGGLFVATRPEHLAYQPQFLQACADCGIPAELLPVEKALRMEPLLNPAILSAVKIPDGTFDPYRLCMAFLATASHNGARVMLFSDVVGIDPARRQVRIFRRALGKEEILEADLIINAGGPWADRIAALAGVKVEVEPSAGVMAILEKRLCNLVMNLMALPGNADIIVPQRNTSMLGTTSWRVDDPDHVPVPEGHVEELLGGCEELIPAVRQTKIRGVMAAARPLLVTAGGGGRNATRGFAIYDHASSGADGFITILGGKTITARLMAEKCADLVCAKLGLAAECRTRETALLSYRLGVSA